MKTAIGYLAKHDDSIYEFFTLKQISLHLLNLGAPPVS